MKKILLFAMGAMMAMPSFAQEEDMTSYIQNPGFDEDISFNADGTATKEITSTGRIADSRGLVFEATDGSLYTKANDGAGTNTNGDPSWYGFITRIKGWEVTNTTNSPAWVYFGSIPYNVEAGLLAVGGGKPAGDVGCPAKPDALNTDDNTGVLMLRAGWANKCTYKQEINLPCAVYRLDYWVKATGTLNSNAKNLSNVECRGDVQYDEDGFNAADWTLHSIEFTPTSKFTIEFGFEAANDLSSKNPIIWIDGIKLYKIGDADPDELINSDLHALEDSLQEWSTAASDANMNGLSNEIYKYLQDLGDLIDDGTLAEKEAGLKKAQEKLAYFKEAYAAAEALDAIITRLDAISEKYNFPGKSDFEQALSTIRNYYDKGTAAQILGAEAEAEAAIAAYVFSQSATADSPADYTLLVKNPWFIKDGMEPTVEDGMADYGDNVPSENLQAGKWYKAGTTTGGDQGVKVVQSRTAWNAWATSIDRVAVAQDLTEIPNGYYTIEADLITQADYANETQKVFGQSAAGKIVSEPLTAGNWDSSDNTTGTGAWTTLTTEKILVLDGNLTIGAEGYGNGATNQSGWFCATNFKLLYSGQPSDDDMKALLQQKLDAANLLADNMHFAADKKALQDSIAKYTGATDVNAAIAAMATALEEAQKSEDKYAEYWMDGKTLPTLRDSLAKEGAYGAAFDIVKYAYEFSMNWIQSDSATYTKIDEKVNLTKNYTNTYAPVYNEAAEVVAKASEAGKNYLQPIMATQKERLLAKMQTADVVNRLVERLKTAANLVEKQNIADDENADDFTAFIINPNAEGTNGWDVNKGNGDGPIKSAGQWMDDSNHPYFDSWNGNGLSGHKLSQVVQSLPNGTYTLGVYARTPAEGAYLFTAVSADTVYAEIPLNYYDNEGTQEIAGDKYGPIWEEAKAQLDVLGEEDDNYAYYKAIYEANGGAGRGWKHMTIDNLVVTDHTLCIGFLAGSIENHGNEKDFAGTWYSVGNFTLTRTAKGDNTGWGGPIADGIETVKTHTAISFDGIYTINGVRTNKLQRGLNIVVRNGKTQKIFVK